MSPLDLKEDNEKQEQNVRVERYSAAETIKLWSDTIFALLKSIFLLIIGIALIVSVTFIVLDNINQRTIKINIDPQSDKLLQDLGVDLELRSMLINTINSNILAVEQIIIPKIFQKINAQSDIEESKVSLKPFGLEMSTNEFTEWLSKIFGQPPGIVVEMKLTCITDSCTTVNSKPSKQSIRLIIDIRSSNNTKNRRLFFNLMNTTRLKYKIREAIKRTSEQILEVAEPLIASDLYLNVPYSIIFPDKQQDYWIHAYALATEIGNEYPNQKCMADNIIAVSSGFRGDLSEANKLFENIADTKENNETCKIHALTNKVNFYASTLICSNYAEERYAALKEVKKSLKRVKELKNMSEDENDRINATDISIDFIELITNSIGQIDRNKLCGGTSSSIDNSSIDSASKEINIDKIFAISKKVKNLLSPLHKNMIYVHNIINSFQELMRVKILYDDRFIRFSVARTIVELIDLYVLKDSEPRPLLLIKGNLLLEMGMAALDTQSLSADERLTFTKKLLGKQNYTVAKADEILHLIAEKAFFNATIEFQNASSTRAGSSLSDPDTFSEMAPIVMLGDAYYVSGELEWAKKKYSSAIENFISNGGPPYEIIWLAKAASRWATILINDGVCKNKKLSDDWGTVWQRLGASTDHDICVFAKDTKPSQQVIDKLGMMKVIFPLISDTVHNCSKNRSEQVIDMKSDPALIFTKTLACIKKNGPDSNSILYSFLRGTTSDIVDNEIEKVFH